MSNELLFLIQVVLVSGGAITALFCGQGALTGLMMVYVILANLFVTKEIVLFGLTVTASDALGVGASCCFALLQEYYDRAVAYRALISSVVGVICYGMMAVLHMAYVPALSGEVQHACELLFSSAPWVIFASLCAYVGGQMVESMVLRGTKRFLSDRYFPLRAGSALLVGQFCDTILFTSIGLYSMVHDPFHVLMFSYLVKVIAILGTVMVLSVLRCVPVRPLDV